MQAKPTGDHILITTAPRVFSDAQSTMR